MSFLKLTKMKLALIFILSASLSSAATIIANSLSRDDVNTALQSAQAGDTVILPAGSANWATGIIWSAPPNVTLQGAGTTATGGGDQTNITDDISNGTAILSIDVAPVGVFRMTGITFQSGSAAQRDNGTIGIAGPGQVRIDHISLKMTSQSNYKAIVFSNGVRGVLYQSILNFTGINALYFYNGRSGSGEIQGNYEWTQPTSFGSADFFFIEDNIVNGTVNSGAYSTRLWDGFTASKVVARFNSLSQSCISETHATGHSGDDRGTRAQEAYGNLVTSSLSHDPNFVMVDVSSGGAMAWGNSANQVFKNIFTMRVTRANNNTYVQQPTPNGWGYAGTEFNGTGSMWDGGTALGTDTVYGYPCLDQPGRGMGQLLVGDFPSKTNQSTSSIYWPNQSLEPIYIWNNDADIVSGWGGSYYATDVNRVSANRDYYPQSSGVQTSPTSPFNGSSGTGWGTLANRPTTCTTGVGYWATDQGSWNKSSSNPYGVQQNGADGVLYVATATNTWTLYYEPYTYPHPLRDTTQAQAPNFSPPAGIYASAQSVTISSATSGATIHYTVDGTTPTTGSPTYSSPVSIASTKTLKAIAAKSGLDDSSVTSGLYTIGSVGDGVVSGTTTVTTTLTLP